MATLLPIQASSARSLGPNTLVSIVIPCFNEQAVLPHLFERLGSVANSWGTDFEIILVDDGSLDRTWEFITRFNQADPRWKGIRLGRNFGHQTALRAGLHAASGSVIAVIDADLQDPPEILRELLQKWCEGYDVVYGVRTQRKEGMVMRAAYFAFYRLLRFLAEMDVPLQAGDFSVMDHGVVNILKRMPERKPFLRGLRSWIGLRQLAFEYERNQRAAGRSKYNWKRLFGLAIDGILSSSIVPLRLATLFGAAVSFTAFLGAVFTLTLRIFPSAFAWLGFTKPIPGTATVVVCVLFMGGVQLLCLGIFGEYLGRIFENVKGRPLWTISETLGVPTPDECITAPSHEHSNRNGDSR